MIVDVPELIKIRQALEDIADQFRIFNQFLADIDERNGFTEPLPAAENGTQSEEGG